MAVCTWLEPQPEALNGNRARVRPRPAAVAPAPQALPSQGATSPAAPAPAATNRGTRLLPAAREGVSRK